MKSKTIAVLTACCFFLAAMGFILFAISMDLPWLILAVIGLIAGLILRAVFPDTLHLSRSINTLSQAEPNTDKENRKNIRAH